MNVAGKIDKLGIAKAMEDGSPENRYLLDKETGAVILVSATMGASELMAFKERMERHPERYLAVDRTHSDEKYRDMELFIKELNDKKLQEKLITLLRGGNPVRPFLDAVNAHPQASEQWKEWKKGRILKRLSNFLKENGLA